jgi:hypothetical protein
LSAEVDAISLDFASMTKENIMAYSASTSNQKRRADGLGKLAWQLLKCLPVRRHLREEYNARSHCPHCDLDYCLGFDGVDMFCRECYYSNSCIKEVIFPSKTCNWCKENINVSMPDVPHTNDGHRL